jgi:excisionase family DNA binding protein
MAAEVASVLRVSRARVYELVRLGSLPFVKLGVKQIRFEEEALRAWIARGGTLRLADEESSAELLARRLTA